MATHKLGRRGFVATLAAISAELAARKAHTSWRTISSIAGTVPGEEKVIGGVRFCWCPPGRFMMGSPAEEVGRRADEDQVAVTLTRGSWMAKFETTQGEWRRLVGAYPDRPPTAEFGIGDNFPMYWVNFPEAEQFCAALTSRARRDGDLPADWEIRIPTEAQWEYGCRAGTTTASGFGDSLGMDQANFKEEPLNGGKLLPAVNRTSPVGSYRGNQWGICDMHGNVFEWCRDWYHYQLPGGTDPDLRDQLTGAVVNRDGTYSRCRRGGAWNDAGIWCRSALRLRYEPERRSDHIGFRVVAVWVGR